MLIEEVVEAWNTAEHEGTALGYTTYQQESHPCGDELMLSLLIEDGVIQDALWECTGCILTKGISEIMCRWIRGLTVQEALLVQVPLEGLSMGRIGCYLLPFQALHGCTKVEAGQRTGADNPGSPDRIPEGT